MAATCAIACKWPLGLDLKLYRMVDVTEGGYSGTRVVKVAEEIPGSERHIRGTNTATKEAMARDRNAPQPLAGSPGYALTHGIEVDWWLEFKRQNHDSEMIRRGFLFAFEDPARAQDAARERERELVGV